LRFLAEERNVKGIVLDTPSLDHGQSRDFMAHGVWLGADKLILENIANVDKLPPKGATIYIAPMKIGNGTGAPARVFALLPQG
jgi:kynurenine formamidase